MTRQLKKIHIHRDSMQRIYARAGTTTEAPAGMKTFSKLLCIKIHLHSPNKASEQRRFKCCVSACIIIIIIVPHFPNRDLTHLTQFFFIAIKSHLSPTDNLFQDLLQKKKKKTLTTLTSASTTYSNKIGQPVWYQRGETLSLILIRGNLNENIT